MSDDSSRDSEVDPLIAEYLRRIDDGEPFDRDAFREEHKEFASELDDFFDAVDALDGIVGSACLENGHDDLEQTVDWLNGDPRRLALASDDDLAGFRLGNYELIRPIGRGGMGVVYEARQVRLDRTVAVKLILAGRLASASIVRRFEREAKAAGKLKHSNIVRVHQTGCVDGQHFYSMDYIEGKTLADISRDHPLSNEDAARYMTQVASAVHYAHQMAVLHRDLKPSNVLIDDSDRAHITDFGLAKQLGTDVDLTDTGSTVGTPGFMSPEQASGKAADVGTASDIYSMGAVLYQLITGRPPFQGESAMATILEVLHKEPDAPKSVNPKVHKDLEAVCLKCLAKDPYSRYGSSQEFEQDLIRFLSREPVHAKSQGLASRAWNWVRDVPLVAALAGRSFAGTTAWHQRAQWCVVAIPLLIALCVLVGHLSPAKLPNVIVIGSGEPEGMYDEFCQAMAAASLPRKSRVERTDGSIENLEKLQGGLVHVALAQLETLNGRGQVRVVAPLFVEVVYVLVRKGCMIADFAELKNRLEGPSPPRLWMGLRQSGMRVSAETVLSKYDINVGRLGTIDCSLNALIENTEADVAVVTAGSHNSSLARILESDQFDLVSLPDAADLFVTHPSFRHHRIPPTGLPRPLRPSDGGFVDTVATVSVLAVRSDATPILVAMLLELLYGQNRLPSDYELISRGDAQVWAGVMRMHSSAREFFGAS